MHKRVESVCRSLALLAVGTSLALLPVVGAARADTDNIVNQTQVLPSAVKITCSTHGPEGFTNTTSFSFDISWVDPMARHPPTIKAARSRTRPMAMF
jgi:hypothetical protein